MTIDNTAIDNAVNRFLAWPIPEDFSPDGGVNIDRRAGTLTGTNLLHAGQAREMFEHCLGVNAASPMPAIGADLPPHQQRVLAEKAELDERRAKLAAFTNGPIFGDLPEPERLHLNEQQRVMAEYSSILGARIAMFGVKAAEEPAAAPITLPVIDPGPDSLEREIQAKANKAPRVTPADIEAEIASTHYFVASDAIQHENAVHEYRYGDGWKLGGTQLLTFCVIQLRNGFTVTGESACASPENFNVEIGRRIARENAVAKLWTLLGFSLRQRLHEQDE